MQDWKHAIKKEAERKGTSTGEEIEETPARC